MEGRRSVKGVEGNTRRWLRGGQVLIAESYGGKDEPVDTLARTFRDINITPIVEPLRVKEDPTEATYQVLLLIRLRGCNPSPHPSLSLCLSPRSLQQRLALCNDGSPQGGCAFYRGAGFFMNSHIPTHTRLRTHARDVLISDVL